MKVTLIDVDSGNTGSIAIAFARLGAEVERTRDPEVIAGADRVVLPGVGAAGYFMAQVDRFGLHDPIRSLTQPVLGICLGMQLLFEGTEEGDAEGFGILPGTVRRMEARPDRIVPHMGWSRLSLRGEPRLGMRDGDYVYFAHSYACDDGDDVVATAEHGGVIPAAVARGNFQGVQFHPERSGEAGARVLEAFLSC